ncbi:MAG: 4Fe-4S ferredoxin [Gammaproteobacteria bacterium HGW-Gammaproteobacteria-1]|jgi:polyferredoxin|nr:MAG: 4Fe-4S ferredoxin [Gammaproteobacteria bacterium HGW-Gammaproteobacteria-1]
MSRLKDAVNGVDLNRFRFWLQLAFFVFLVYGGFFAVELGNQLPTFSCGYNSEGRAGMCYLMSLQHQLAWPWPKLFGVAALTVATGLGVFLLWFAVLNKAWCGFACPLGTLQDWITALRRRLGVRYSRYTQGQFRRLTTIKYLLLALALLLPLGIGGGMLSKDLRTPFCDICPARMIIPTFTGNFSHWTIDFSTKTAMAMSALGLIVTGLFFIGAFVKKRFFCFFCPMSALHYLFSRLALLRLRKDGAKCTRCGDCYRVCDMEIREIADEVDRPQIMMDDCTLCLKCVASCPEEGALKATFAGIPIFESTERGFVKRMNKP